MFDQFVRRGTTVALGITALSALYFFWQMSPWASLLVVAGCIALGWFLPRSRLVSIESAPATPSAWKLAAVVILIDLGLLATFVFARTHQAIVSPWDRIPLAALGLYALATMFVVFLLRLASWRQAMPLLTLHAFVSWSVSAIVFGNGFGYDPFVHQATESFILRHGFILPKQPMYVGQYVLVVALAQWTRIAVTTLDQWLVPVLAAVVVPFSLWFGLSRGWSKMETRVLPGMIALFLFPLMALTFTVPFNLALIGWLIAIVLLPLAHDRAVRHLLFALAAATLVTHPLLGIPLAVVVAVRCFWPERLWKWAALLVALAIPLGLVVAFSLYARMAGGTITFDWSALSVGWLVLFGNPYDPDAPLIWRAFYDAVRAWPWMLAAFGVWGIRRAGEWRTLSSQILFGAMIGLVVTALCLASFVRLPNIISAEQFEFALRLLGVAPLVMLPGVALAIAFVTTRVKLFSVRGFLLAGVIGLCATGAWYVSYSQNNPAAHFTAAGVGESDFQIVDEIEREAGGLTYAVLSPQMTSAAALRRFGFERGILTPAGPRYFYAVPTGGELYAFYLQLFSSPDPKIVLADAFAFTETKLLFVVVPQNWDRAGSIDVRLRPLAKEVNKTGQEATIYRFESSR